MLKLMVEETGNDHILRPGLGARASGSWCALDRSSGGSRGAV